MTLWLLLTVWCLLLAGAVLAPQVGGEWARLAAYAACAALVLAAQPRGAARARPLAAALAGAAGFAALPAWLALIGALGACLGLAPPRHASVSIGPAGWLAHVALAPLFEELLHRGRVLPALRARLGAPLALVASSALFAAPHLEPWSVLGTFCVGLALGGLLLATGRVGLCVAYHAGANAAVLACGLPPLRLALPPGEAALAASALLGLALAWTRRRGAWPRVHRAARRAGAARPREARTLHTRASCQRSASGS